MVGTYEHHPTIFHLSLFPLEYGGQATYIETQDYATTRSFFFNNFLIFKSRVQTTTKADQTMPDMPCHGSNLPVQFIAKRQGEKGARR